MGKGGISKGGDISDSVFDSDQYEEGSVWFYAPNKVAPIVFVVLFLISGVLHAYQTWRYKSWRYTILMPWAATIMCAGFATREAGAYDVGSIPFLIASIVLIMSGPPVYAAINYFVLSRIMFYIPYLSPLHPGRVVTTFLAIDGIIEILIAQGAARISNREATKTEREVGGYLVKASLILQAAMFFVFCSLALHFHVRAVRARVMNPKLSHVLYVLYASSALITIRCIYRIVEFFEGWTGTLNTNEPYFWVFDATLMFINTAILNIWHPGMRLPPNNETFLSRDGKTELRGPGWKDDRPFWVTFFDPFDLVGLCTGRDKKTRFWEMSPEELEQFCEQEKARRAAARPIAIQILDPFHIFGSGGLFSGSKNKQPLVVQNDKTMTPPNV